MYHLSHRLWIAISICTLAFGSSYPVIAQPKVATTIQTGSKASGLDDVSPQPVEAVLANLKPRPSVRSTIRVPQRSAINRKSPIKITNSSRTANAGRSIPGISHLIETDRDPDFSAVNQLIK